MCVAYFAVNSDPWHIGVGWVKAGRFLGVHQFQLVALTPLIAGLNIIPVHGGHGSTLLVHSWVLLSSMCEGTVKEWPEDIPGW